MTKSSFSRVFGLSSALAIAASLFIAPMAAAEPMTMPVAAQSTTQLPGVAVAPHGARVVSVYRTLEAEGYAASPARLGDVDDGYEAIGHREMVHIDIALQHPSPSRLDAFEHEMMTSISVDPSRLSAAQRAALAQPTMSQRVAAFAVTANTTNRTARVIDYSQSQFCDSDQLRCADEVVYKNATVETVSYELDA